MLLAQVVWRGVVADHSGVGDMQGISEETGGGIGGWGINGWGGRAGAGESKDKVKRWLAARQRERVEESKEENEEEEEEEEGDEENEDELEGSSGLSVKVRGKRPVK